MTATIDKNTDEIVYFASVGKDQVAEELSSLIQQISDDTRSEGWYSLLSRSYNAYYGLSEEGGIHASSDIFADGVQGELARAKINHFRNLIQHVLVMATSSRPAFQAQATNSDPKSLEQTILANGILEYYLRTKRIEEKLALAAESALVYGEGYIALDWDPSQGDPYTRDGAPSDEEEGGVVYSGDVVCNNYTYLDVFRDSFRSDQDDDWIIVRDWVNRFELIAQYPDLKESLLKTPNKEEVMSQQMGRHYTATKTRRSELIPVYRFYHKRTSAVPEGRTVGFVDNETMLYDSPLPYKEVPVYRIAPGEMLETNKGYSTAFDVLSIQKIIDTLHSIILSNQSATGVQLLWVPQGADLNYRELAEGLTVISTPMGQKPESIQLTNTAKETFDYLDLITKQGELLWGVSSVNRGQPEKSLRTGSALALVQAMSIQFNSAFQRSWVHLLEKVGSGLIQILKDYATTPRIAMITGKHNQSFLKSFTSEDLGSVDLVTVDAGSPLAQTTAGRVQMADTLLERGIITNIEGYTQVMSTGRLETVIEGQRSQMLLIKRENEMMANGQNPPVMPTDNPILHIQEHMSVLASPEARMDEEILQATMGHIQQHVDDWQTLSQQNPNLLMAMGIQPIAPVAPEQMAPQMQQGPGGGPLGSNAAADVLGGQEEAIGDIAEMPEAPVNPQTGQKANIQVPGGPAAPGAER